MRPTASLHLDAGREFHDAERHVLSLLQGLVSRGHRVLLCSPRTAALHRQAVAAGIPCEALTLRSSLDFPSAVRLARLVRDQSFDLIHAHDPPSHSIALAAQGMSGERALAANLFVTHGDLGEGGASAPRLGLAASGVHHIARSKPVRDALVERGVDPRRIAVVPAGIDVARLRQPRNNGGDPWGLGARGLRLVGTVGPLRRDGNVGLLLQAFAMVRAQHADAHLLVVGEGPARGQLERRCRDLGLGAAVTFTAPPEDLAALYGALQIYVLATDVEGSITSILEAMAAGTPVVTTALAGVLGFARHGASALVVPTQDAKALAQAIGLLLQQEDLAARLVQGGYAVAEQHTLERMVESTLRVYHELGQLPP